MRTITVNAAFLQEVKDDNHFLRSLMEMARRALLDDLPSHHSPREFADLLCQLRDQLAMHFALEEAFGYFEDALDVAPQLSRQADLLRAQHQVLYVAICEIAEEAEQLLYHETPVDLRAEMRDRFAGFYEEFQDHEACENALILEAFDDDIGVGD
jgi:hypothetical protein